MISFYILTRPRSGSHMLASALDSHPDIQCKGEIDTPRYNWLGGNEGKVKGFITHVKVFNGGRPKRYITDAGKVIVLLRDLSKRIGYEGEHHYMGPARVKADESGKIEEYDPQSLINLASKVDNIILHYEQMTGNEDMREIPELIARRICNFLEVDYHPLTPAFYKPIIEDVA